MSYSVLVEKDVSIRLRDGGAIVADVFGPAEPGEFPTIMTLGPYPKDIHFSQWNPVAWEPGARAGAVHALGDGESGVVGAAGVRRHSL